MNFYVHNFSNKFIFAILCNILYLNYIRSSTLPYLTHETVSYLFIYGNERYRYPPLVLCYDSRKHIFGVISMYGYVYSNI